MSRHARPLFQELESSGRFHRDSRLGRLFHPGTVSYREISEIDSVHLSVTSENRVSVHVDRVSPLLVSKGGQARYSLCRAVAHNATVLAEVVCRLVRRQPSVHRCHLDCEIVWVPDDDLDGFEDCFEDDAVA
ncbi:MAG: hypothetical protein ACRD2W_13055 [Acidimicrobiales bacterium]